MKHPFLDIAVAALALAACGENVPLGGAGPSSSGDAADGGGGPTGSGGSTDSGGGFAFPDAAPANDAADANIDVGAPVPCEAGAYFIVVNDPPATHVLREGCSDAGPAAPSVATELCGEDWACPVVRGCDGPVALGLSVDSISIQAAKINVGVWPAAASFTDGDAGAAWGSGGTVRIKTVDPVGRTVSGDYVIRVAEPFDGGDARVLSGTFCVLPL
jgi:hypothetical protein